jgi:PAS domain-containing protein
MRSPRATTFSTELFGNELPDAGFFTWDLPENVLYADKALATLFGVDPAEAEQGLPIEVYLARVHPQDAPILAKAISDSIIAHRPQQQSYRVCNSEGVYVTVMCFGRGFRDAKGEPVRYVGIVVPADSEDDIRRDH